MMKANWKNQVVVTAIVLLVSSGIANATIYQADFGNFDSSDNRWNITNGSWSNHIEGVQNDGSSYRNWLFINNLTLGTDSYTVSATATLNSGYGWAVFFDGQLNDSGAYSGLTLQYDPGWGDGAIILREWQDNQEAYPKTISWFDEQFNAFGTSHSLTVERAGADVTVYLDEQVLFTESISEPAGGLLGLRSWANSEVVFQSLQATDDINGSAVVPEPATIALLGLGSIVLIRKKK